jgi:hypothetical protein
MRRIFLWLSLMAVGLALLLLASPDGPSTSAGTQVLQGAPVAYGGWAAGLFMGLCLAWLASIDWGGLPTRVLAWFGLQGRRAMMMAVAGLLFGILLYF